MTRIECRVSTEEHCPWCGWSGGHLERPERCPEYEGTISGYPAPLMKEPRPYTGPEEHR